MSFSYLAKTLKLSKIAHVMDNCRDKNCMLCSSMTRMFGYCPREMMIYEALYVIERLLLIQMDIAAMEASIISLDYMDVSLMVYYIKGNTQLSPEHSSATRHTSPGLTLLAIMSYVLNTKNAGPRT